jgi:hypothetical protein
MPYNKFPCSRSGQQEGGERLLVSSMKSEKSHAGGEKLCPSVAWTGPACVHCTKGSESGIFFDFILVIKLQSIVLVPLKHVPAHRCLRAEPGGMTEGQGPHVLPSSGCTDGMVLRQLFLHRRGTSVDSDSSGDLANTGNNHGKSARRTVCVCLMVWLAVFAGLVSPASAETGLKKARLMPLWSPQAQFAGYYMALEKGIYARHGIDLTILTGGPGRSAIQSLTNGEADFAVLWLSTALQQHDAGLKLVNLAQIVPRSSLRLWSARQAASERPRTFKEKKSGCGTANCPCRFWPSLTGITSRYGGSPGLYRQPVSPGRSRCGLGHVVQ